LFYLFGNSSHSNLLVPEAEFRQWAGRMKQQEQKKSGRFIEFINEDA
jgi:hypothetical protein